MRSINLGLLCCLTVITTVARAEHSTRRPNVVLIMTDDQGYGDLSCHGNPILKTPNLDKLYAQSTRFTNFHVDSTCSPTRSALMSGCYSHRVNVWHTHSGHSRLERGRPTMATVFRDAGYRTAHFGKWHLGGDYPLRPIDRGFDEWIGQGDGGTGSTGGYWGNDRVNDHYFCCRGDGQVSLKRIDGFGPDVFFEGAADFIRRNKAKPFFIYLATYLPHTPLTLPSKEANDYYQARLAGNPRSNKKLSSFFAAIADIDRNIGRLRDVLAEEGLADNTIFVFLTDNGGTQGVKLFNAGMRGKKLSVYDGGHRVPCFIHWPAGGLDRPRDIGTLTAHFDLLPTLADLCGIELPEGAYFDGKSLNPLLDDPAAAWPARTFVVETQRVRVPVKYRQFAVMTDRWRLVGNELYDMSVDPGQKTDVAARFPDVVRRLRAAYDRYWNSVSANDSIYTRSVVGAKTPELVLDVHDQIHPHAPWSQGTVASGQRMAIGFWPIEVADAGTYRFELRRWPRETDAPISGLPTVRKQPDAWLYDRPVKYLMYRGKPKAYPACKARLTVGGRTLTRAFDRDARSVVFEVPLKPGELEVRACFENADGKDVPTAFYVYVSKQ